MERMDTEDVCAQIGIQLWMGEEVNQAPLDASFAEIALGNGVGKQWTRNSGGCTRMVVGRIPIGGQQMTKHGTSDRQDWLRGRERTLPESRLGSFLTFYLELVL